MTQAALFAAISANGQNIPIDGRAFVRLESVRGGQIEVDAMVSTLLSIAFGIAGFLVFFGFGSGWEFSLGVGVATAIGLWASDRSTTTPVSPIRAPTGLTTQHMTTRARRRAFAWLSSHVLPRSQARARLLRVNSHYRTSSAQQNR